MTFLSSIKSASNDPSKFLGRPASPCRKCSGSSHYVNRLGGVVCLVCDPPGKPEDNLLALVIECGQWCDPLDGFALPVATHPAGNLPGQVSAGGGEGAGTGSAERIESGGGLRWESVPQIRSVSSKRPIDWEWVIACFGDTATPDAIQVRYERLCRENNWDADLTAWFLCAVGGLPRRAFQMGPFWEIKGDAEAAKFFSQLIERVNAGPAGELENAALMEDLRRVEECFSDSGVSRVSQTI